MAEQLLFTYNIQGDLRSGDATASALNGGIIQSFYDDSTGTILVRDAANDAELTATDFQTNTTLGIPLVLNFNAKAGTSQAVISGGTDVGTSQSEWISNYQFCTGTTLTRFKIGSASSYPFVFRNNITGSAECGAVACDLTIDNVDVVDETASGSADGEITVTATSSQSTIQYALFPFDFGAGGTSNVFENLVAGNYTIYVADNQNCKAQLTVTVDDLGGDPGGGGPVDPYGDLYRIGYKDINGNSARFTIRERSYTGSLTEVTSKGIPLTYVLNEVDQFDIFTGVQPSYVNINLPELSKFGYLDLFTQDSRKYLGIWEKDIGSGFVELWRGFLEPITFTAGYNWQPDITLTFKDGLATLDKFNYLDGGKVYNDKKLIKIIADGLSKTDLQLNINSALNIYENSHATTDADDPLDQTFIDQESFYNADDGTARDYKSILNQLIKPFGAIIRQWQGAWWILRIEELQDSFDYRTFDSLGDYVSNSTYSNGRVYHRRACITDARAVFTEGSQNLEILKPAKEFNITFKFDKRESILENFSFERLATSIDPVLWTANLGDAFPSSVNVTNLSNNGNFAFQFAYGVTTQNFSETYVQSAQKNIQFYTNDKIKIEYEIGVDRFESIIPYFIIRTEVKIGSDYLQPDGTWSTTVNQYRSYITPSQGYQTVDIEVDAPEVTGLTEETLDVKLYTYALWSADFGYRISTTFIDGETDFRAESTTDKPDGYITSVITNGFVNSLPYLFYYRLETGIDAQSIPSVIRPDDYNASTNPAVWKLIDPYIYANNDTSVKSNLRYYIDDVKINVLPNGDEIDEEVNIRFTNDSKYTDDYDYEITAGDVPDNVEDLNLQNAKNIFNNLFKLSGGGNTNRWTRDGVNELQTIQQLLAKAIVRQYSTPTFKLSGTLTTNNQGTHQDITPLSHIVETQDNGKIYYINGLTINDKDLLYEVNLVHSKASTTFPAASGFCDVADGGGGTDNDGGNGNSFQGGFSSGFGNSFNTIFN